MRKDQTRFPAKSYKETVLEPLFEDFKKHFYREMMRINYAQAIMLAEEEIISRKEAETLIRGLKELEEEVNLNELEYTGEFEDVFFYIEDQLIKKIGIEVAGKLHIGRSRNDMDITMYKMKLKKQLREVMGLVINLVETLLQSAEIYKEKIIIAYTHGQPAQPTTYGHYLAALIEILLRDLERLFHSYRTTDSSSMGAAAITTSGFGLNRERMAELLGFAEVQENSYGCIAAVDYLTEVYSCLKIMFISLGRFIQDLGQWTGFDVNHLYVPNEFVQISSIMPQKRNPVPVEHLRVLSSMTIGYCDTVINTLHNTPFTDMNDAEDPIQQVGLQAFSTTRRVLILLKDFIKGLRVNGDKIKKHLQENFVTVTELADSLVRREGISLRQAHEITRILIKDLLARGNSLEEFDYRLFQKVFKEVIKRESQLNEEELKKILRPEYFIAVRETTGGPGPGVLSRSIKGYQERIQEFKDQLTDLENQQDTATVKLKETINQYLKLG